MKFAHGFQEALRREGFPPHWVDSAVPYSQLKKCIKKVEGELRTLGLDLKTLGQLTPATNSGYPSPKANHQSQSEVAFLYNFADGSQTLRPQLTLFVQLRDGAVVDAALSPDTRQFLANLAAEQAKRPQLLHSPEKTITNEEARDDFDCNQDTRQVMTDGRTHPESDRPPAEAIIRRVEVPLIFDAEFFGLLQDDVSTLYALQEVEERAMIDEIGAIGKDVARLSAPSSRSGKTDLYRWREIFDLYLQAAVFFSTNELDHGSRNSATALKQLQWFQAEVMSRDLVGSFKANASRRAFDRFTKINFTLLRNLKFQEINQLAISKILKKFDKRTSLGAKNTFPRLLGPDAIVSETMAKAVCASLSNEVVKVVPQLDDYLCPVCYSIAYRPVRLGCGHIFCIRCMIQMQKSRSEFCPLCRERVVMKADSDNLDQALTKFLQRYFPKESKAKQKDNERAAAIELYGESVVDMKCEIM